MNIGLFYGSSTCYTEMAAEKIRDIIGPELVTLHNLKDDSPALMSQYDVLIDQSHLICTPALFIQL